MLTKPQARQYIKALWPGLDWPALSAQAAVYVPQFMAMAASRLGVPHTSQVNVLGYAPITGELDLTPGWQPWQPRLWLPKVQGNQLLAGKAAGPLQPGAFGIAEPTTALTGNWLALCPWVLWVPCVGITPEGYRLGRGKGYYDRLLAQLPAHACITVGVCPQACVLPQHTLTPDAWDIPLNALLTEQGVQWF
jgi:5-formyltetrahydrofolate cyclo-ligase